MGAMVPNAGDEQGWRRQRERRCAHRGGERPRQAPQCGPRMRYATTAVGGRSSRRRTRVRAASRLFVAAATRMRKALVARWRCPAGLLLTARPRFADRGDQGCAARNRARARSPWQALSTRFSEEATVAPPSSCAMSAARGHLRVPASRGGAVRACQATGLVAAASSVSDRLRRTVRRRGGARGPRACR
jgi:hypothetical protein